MRQRCIGFDRVIDTDRPICGTLPFDDGDCSRRAIRVRWRDAAPVPGEPIPIWSMVGGTLCFAAPGVARYLCDAGAIEVIPETGAARDEIEALLIATALPAVLWLQGGFLLHASAIVPRGREGALAIAGPSGIGKSTLAAAFVASGAASVADDSIVVDADRDELRCSGLPGGWHLGVDDDRSFHTLRGESACRSAPLRAIVMLDDAPPAACRSRLEPLDALHALLIHRHRANVPRYCGLEPRLLDATAHLARTVPVYRWPRCEADALSEENVLGAIMRGVAIREYSA